MDEDSLADHLGVDCRHCRAGSPGLDRPVRSKYESHVLRVLVAEHGHRAGIPPIQVDQDTRRSSFQSTRIFASFRWRTDKADGGITTGIKIASEQIKGHIRANQRTPIDDNAIVHTVQARVHGVVTILDQDPVVDTGFQVAITIIIPMIWPTITAVRFGDIISSLWDFPTQSLFWSGADQPLLP